jgi:flagellar motility protein MotE (MotC chaperone)
MSDTVTPRFRLLPLTIGFLSLLLFSKSFEVYTGTHLLLAGEAYAQEEAPEKAAAQDEKKTENKETETEAAPAEDAPKDEAIAQKPADETQSTSAEEQKVANRPIEDPVLSQQAYYSPVEVDLLQRLSARRDELNSWEKDIKMKESLLEATEVRLDRKIDEIQGMQASLRTLLDEYSKHEEAEIRSLVKIYENMKPKDAAQIFDEMEMPILLLVVDKMSERKAAPILALMTPAKAKDLTVELADQRKVRNQLTQQSSDAAGAPVTPR